METIKSSRSRKPMPSTVTFSQMPRLKMAGRLSTVRSPMLIRQTCQRFSLVISSQKEMIFSNTAITVE